MKNNIDILAYWKCTISQEAEKMREFFDKNAIINWHNTNESLSFLQSPVI